MTVGEKLPPQTYVLSLFLLCLEALVFFGMTKQQMSYKVTDDPCA